MYLKLTRAPIVFETNMKFLKIKWSPNGSILAVSGVQSITTTDGVVKEFSIVQFYDSFGNVN